MRLLVVEDDLDMMALLVRALRRAGYTVDTATNGVDAVGHIRQSRYDTIVLDAMIPPPDGFEVCRRIRAERMWVPVLILTARQGVSDRVQGLDAGADDYLTKPFALAELLARLRALTRRDPRERPAVLRAGDLTLDPANHTVRRAGTEVALSPKEFALLQELMRQPGRVLTRSYLIDHVWDFAEDATSNVVDVYIRYLRNKIDRPYGRASIRTVRGVGYRLDA